MKKIDLHMHMMTTVQLPKIGKFNLSSPKGMIAHMEELGIGKAVLMSSGEKKIPFGKNSVCKKVCDKYPEHFAWMCMLDEKDIETVHERLSAYKEQGAIGVGELTINKRLEHPFLQEIFASAEKLSLPVTIHMSPEEGYSYGVVDEPGLPYLEKVLQNYPNLKMIGHSQTFWIEMSGDAPTDKEGRNSWGSGPAEEYRSFLKNTPICMVTLVLTVADVPLCVMRHLAYSFWKPMQTVSFLQPIW